MNEGRKRYTGILLVNIDNLDEERLERSHIEPDSANCLAESLSDLEALKWTVQIGRSPFRRLVAIVVTAKPNISRDMEQEPKLV